MTPLKAGDLAPKFSLPDQDGEEVNLHHPGVRLAR